MVKNIYFVEIPYSNFSKVKGRPILIFKELENDYLYLPLTSNLSRSGVLLNSHDLENGILKKESVIIVPKISAIDKNLIAQGRLIGTLKENKFDEVVLKICNSLGCIK